MTLRKRGEGLQAQVWAAEREIQACQGCSLSTLSHASTALGGRSASTSSCSFWRSPRHPSPPTSPPRAVLSGSEERGERERLRAQLHDLEERHVRLANAAVGRGTHPAGGSATRATLDCEQDDLAEELRDAEAASKAALHRALVAEAELAQLRVEGAVQRLAT